MYRNTFFQSTWTADENHYTTPYDIYLMLNEAFTYPEFTEMPSYTVTYTAQTEQKKAPRLPQQTIILPERQQPQKMLQFSV